MSKFNPNKLFVYYKDNISSNVYVSPRKYTLIHSDITGQLFLTIGKDYDYDNISDMRDEVLATWKETENGKVLEIFLHLDTNEGLGTLIIRDKIFRQELPLAIEAIIYGDKALIQANFELLKAPIIVYFKSKIVEYNVVESWGNIDDYNIKRTNGNGTQTQEEMIKKSQEMTQQLEVQYPLSGVPSPYHSAQTPFVNIEASYTPQSVLPIGNPDGKYHIIEKCLIISLEPYIEKQVSDAFGKNVSYCLQKAKILETKVVNYTCKCLDEYEVVIGIMVGEKLPIYNNFIIRFLLSEEEIKVLNAKVIK